MTFNLSAVMCLIKARQHKYTHRKLVGRDPKTGRARYRYYYAEHHGGGITSAEIEEGSAFNLTFKGRRGHFHVQSVEGDTVTVKHDGRPNSKPVEMSKTEFRALLKRQHEAVENKKREKAQENRRRGSKAQKREQAQGNLKQRSKKTETSNPVDVVKTNEVLIADESLQTISGFERDWYEKELGPYWSNDDGETLIQPQYNGSEVKISIFNAFDVDDMRDLTRSVDLEGKSPQEAAKVVTKMVRSALRAQKGG